MNYPSLEVLGYGVLIGIIIFKLFSLKYLFGGKLFQEIPPGSMGWPLIGETMAFLQPHESNSMGNFLQQRCSRYGKVFRSHLFGSPTIVSCDQELNSFILQNEGKLFTNNLPKIFKKFVGEQSIVYVSGQDHKMLRNVTVSFLSTFKISPDFLSYIEKMTVETIDPWKYKNRKAIHFLKEVQQFTSYILLKRLLDIDKGDINGETIQKEVFLVMKGLRSLPIYIPGNSYDKAIKARKKLDSIITRVINEKNKKYNAKEIDQNDNKGFVNEKLMKNDLNKEEKGMAIRTLLGGYETTSELLSLVVYFLARSPSVYKELKQEHKSLRKDKKDDEPLSLQDYKKMDFTLKVINESLRCGNVAKFVPRKAIMDIRYKGFLIPLGWQVIPMFSAIHMDPSLHENPCEFNPWRWNDHENTRRYVTPFGGGPRHCPGAELAKLVTAFFLHHFILNFSWKITRDECPMLRSYLVFKRDMLLELESS